MRKIIFGTIFFLIFSLITPNLTLHSQEVDLVKLKKEEEERRKKLAQQKKKTVVITNETLKQYDDPAKKNDDKKKPAVKKKPQSSKLPEKVDPKNTKEYWQKLKNDLENTIKELKLKIAENQLELNRLNTQYLIMDLPLEKQRIKEEKDKLAQLLEYEKKMLKDKQAELDALPEKARKAGAPPGWLR